MTHISDPHFAKRVLASFDKQSAMHLVKATMPVVEHGLTEIHVPHWEGIEQQHGFVHGGVVGMIADSSAGYADHGSGQRLRPDGRVQDESGCSC
jgi:acyl-coenzyme A thioesterase PaaI-like protein